MPAPRHQRGQHSADCAAAGGDPVSCYGGLDRVPGGQPAGGAAHAFFHGFGVESVDSL